MLHAELKEAHAGALVRLRAVDAELEALLCERRAHLKELEGLRARVDLRYGTRHGGRRRPMVDEPPVPPTPPDAVELWGVDLRVVCVRLLRRHGAHRLRDLHGLLHCYGYAVAGPRPVKDLAEAMRYETDRGRLRRVSRGVYEADPEAGEVPYPGWLGDPPEDRLPLPWSVPVVEPGPPLVDPPVAEDPALWAGEGYPDDRVAVDPAETPPAEDGPAEPDPAPTAAPDIGPGVVGTDSGPNRSPREPGGGGSGGGEGASAGGGSPDGDPTPDEPP